MKQISISFGISLRQISISLLWHLSHGFWRPFHRMENYCHLITYHSLIFGRLLNGYHFKEHWTRSLENVFFCPETAPNNEHRHRWSPTDSCKLNTQLGQNKDLRISRPWHPTPANFRGPHNFQKYEGNTKQKNYRLTMRAACRHREQQLCYCRRRLGCAGDFS